MGKTLYHIKSFYKPEEDIWIPSLTYNCTEMKFLVCDDATLLCLFLTNPDRFVGESNRNMYLGVVDYIYFVHLE
jgi:hypothetical protein